MLNSEQALILVLDIFRRQTVESEGVKISSVCAPIFNTPVNPLLHRVTNW